MAERDVITLYRQLLKDEEAAKHQPHSPLPAIAEAVVALLVVILIAAIIALKWRAIYRATENGFVYIASRFYRAGIAISRRKAELARRIHEAAEK